MGEHEEGSIGSPLGQKVSRRDFLRKSTKAAVTAGAGAVFGGTMAREVKIGQDGLKTEHATFVPMYECHYRRLSEVPDNLQILFCEVAMPREAFECDPLYLLMAPGITEGVFRRLTSQGTKVMFGDVDPLHDKEMIAMMALEGGLSVKICAELMNKSNQGTSRRNLLKGVAGGVALWGTGRVAFGSASVGVDALTAGRQNAIQRILDRAGSVLEHTHPENIILEYRNAICAAKLLSIAEWYHEKFGHKPRIGVNMGRGHAGIEDFLVAGRPTCLAVLTAYPNIVINDFAEGAGGVENMATTRLFSLPPVYEDLGKPRGEIQEEKLVDSEMLKALKSKLRI